MDRQIVSVRVQRRDRNYTSDDVGMNKEQSVLVSRFYIWSLLNIRSLGEQGLNLFGHHCVPSITCPGHKQFLLNEHLNKPGKRTLPRQTDHDGLWAGR